MHVCAHDAELRLARSLSVSPVQPDFVASVYDCYGDHVAESPYLIVVVAFAILSWSLSQPDRCCSPH